MRILALDPYHGGSHESFLAGWAAHSRHDHTVVSLPGRQWKWRMRHGAWTLAERCRELDGHFDLVFTTDMLDLPAWRGFAPASLRELPTAVYFHENQLLYPDPGRGERDFHFAFTNLMTGAAADAVWFNSAWHRDEFVSACRELLRRMPDFAPVGAVDRVEHNSAVLYPGVLVASGAPPRAAGRPPHILWAARWEQDKAPEDVIGAVMALAERGVAFRMSMIGRASDRELAQFADARRQLGTRVVDWGWCPDRTSYEQVLASADVVVSTARHEFFGIAMVEAVAAGAFPLLPRRLAYPEVFSGFAESGLDDGTYGGDAADLAARLEELCGRHGRGDLWQGSAERGRRAVARYLWSTCAAELDRAASELVLRR